MVARGRVPGPRGLAATIAAVAIAGCALGGPAEPPGPPPPNPALYAPTPEMMLTAPDSFVVEMSTSEGPIKIRMRRHWSPAGVDRLYHLMSHDFYAGARIYRVVQGFVAQFGFSGDPALDSIWLDMPIEDEPVVDSNLRGRVSFARAGPETRSITLFINLDDNERLDSANQNGVIGYPPVGEVESDPWAPAGFFGAYDLPGLVQDSIRILGNDYLRQNYPQMDSIIGTRVLEIWPS